jgi:predicted DCC family thiol-disulfide oxidoreductase YuxK
MGQGRTVDSTTEPANSAPSAQRPRTARRQRAFRRQPRRRRETVEDERAITSSHSLIGAESQRGAATLARGRQRPYISHKAMTEARPIPATPDIRVLYDGECPFCANYVALARLRERLGEVELIDARERSDLVEAHAAAGRPIDDGMIVETPDAVYFGGDAVWAINTLLSTNTVLRAMGRKPIDPAREKL